MMIIGDPYKFSIMLDMVEEWNIDSSFYNGILFFSIDGKELCEIILTLENWIDKIYRCSY